MTITSQPSAIRPTVMFEIYGRLVSRPAQVKISYTVFTSRPSRFFRNTPQINTYLRGAFKLQGLLIFFSGIEADRNVKVVGGDVAVL